MSGVMGPIHLMIPSHDPEFFPGTTSFRTYPTFVKSLHAFHQPFSVIRALNSDLLDCSGGVPIRT